MNRREVIGSAAAALVAGWAPPAVAQDDIPMDVLSEAVRLILPADDLSPDAAALGIPQEIAASIAPHPLLRQLMIAGLEWMDSGFGQRFESFPEAQRIEILMIASQADYNQGPGRFFYVLRNMVMEFYYAGPMATQGLPLNTAPQPDGYLPPWS